MPNNEVVAIVIRISLEEVAPSGCMLFALCCFICQKSITWIKHFLKFCRLNYVVFFLFFFLGGGGGGIFKVYSTESIGLQRNTHTLGKKLHIKGKGF